MYLTINCEIIDETPDDVQGITIFSEQNDQTILDELFIQLEAEIESLNESYALQRHLHEGDVEFLSVKLGPLVTMSRDRQDETSAYKLSISLDYNLVLRERLPLGSVVNVAYETVRRVITTATTASKCHESTIYPAMFSIMFTSDLDNEPLNVPVDYQDNQYGDWQS